MRHRRKRGKLGVKTGHRKALLRNMLKNLVIHRRIETTHRRAKEVSSYADQMVELAKRGADLHARRTLIARLGCADTANALITKIAPHFKERKGGYTRVLRMGWRKGDCADMALLEFTAGVELLDKPKKAKKEKKAKEKEHKHDHKHEHKHEEEPVEPKKEKSKKESSKQEEKKGASEEKKESEKKGGFLGKLRRFLKGEEETR